MCNEPSFDILIRIVTQRCSSGHLEIIEPRPKNSDTPWLYDVLSSLPSQCEYGAEEIRDDKNGTNHLHTATR